MITHYKVGDAVRRSYSTFDTSKGKSIRVITDIGHVHKVDLRRNIAHVVFLELPAFPQSLLIYFSDQDTHLLEKVP